MKCHTPKQQYKKEGLHWGQETKGLGKEKDEGQLIKAGARLVLCLLGAGLCRTGTA